MYNYKVNRYLKWSYYSYSVLDNFQKYYRCSTLPESPAPLTPKKFNFLSDEVIEGGSPLLPDQEDNATEKDVPTSPFVTFGKTPPKVFRSKKFQLFGLSGSSSKEVALVSWCQIFIKKLFLLVSLRICSEFVSFLVLFFFVLSFGKDVNLLIFAWIQKFFRNQDNFCFHIPVKLHVVHLMLQLSVAPIGSPQVVQMEKENIAKEQVQFTASISPHRKLKIIIKTTLFCIHQYFFNMLYAFCSYKYKKSMKNRSDNSE